MTSGVGFQEILLIGVLVLLMFGAKGVSGVMRDLGRLAGKLKRYREEFSRELLAISNPHTQPVDTAAIQNEEKDRLRRETLKTMIGLTPEAKAEQSRAVRARLETLEEYRKAKKIFCYLSLPHEVDTRPLIEAMLGAGKAVYLPYCILEETKIGIAPVTDLTRDTAPGAFGILEPRKELRAAVDPLLPDLFIIPGVAFDGQLSRVGRGKGFFDRFLKEIKGKRPLWAVAFREQLVSFVPHMDHDIRPDQVITPDRLYTASVA